MNRPAVFFDRDNTLIACDGYLGDPDKVVLVEGAAEAVARVRDLGFAAVVFSNQSGVARGMFPEEAVHAVNHRLDDLLHEENPRATIDRHDFCPYHPTAKVERYRVDSELRKPKPGMIYQAASVLNLDLPRSWVVGDAPRDIAAGQTAGLRTVLLKIASLPPSPATSEGAGAAPDYVATSLKDAIDFIARNLDRPGTATANGASAAGPKPSVPAASDTRSSGGDAWTAGTSSSAAPGASVPAATTEGSDVRRTDARPGVVRPTTPRTEDPVKLQPRPKPQEPVKPAATKPEAVKPEAAKPDGAKQGGFVVKPNQGPVGMTWGERMRLAKGGGAITSAVSATGPTIPQTARPTVSTVRPVSEATTPTPAPQPEVESDAKATVAPEPVSPPAASAAAEVTAPGEQAPVAVNAPTPPIEPPTVAAPEVAEAITAEPVKPEPMVSRMPTAVPSAASSTNTAESSVAAEAAAMAAEEEREPIPAARAPEPDVIPEVVPTAPDPAPREPRRGMRREDLAAQDETSDAASAVAPERVRPTRDLGDPSRVEALLEQILIEMRRRDDLSSADFSASKLLAGITQVLALAALFYSYLNKDTNWLQATLLVAIALQTLTISLLIMGRQK